MNKKKFVYKNIFNDTTQMFRLELYKRICLERLFLNKKVLDVGCGYGVDVINFSKFAKSVTGVDVAYHSSWKNNKNKKIKFTMSNSDKLPFLNEEFEGVFLKDLLHHINNRNKTLEEIKRVSSKGAHIVILEGNRYNPIFYIYATRIKGHKHFSQKQFRSMIIQHFPNVTFYSIEIYPPFIITNKLFYKILIKLERLINKIKILNHFFSYNVAIIER